MLLIAPVTSLREQNEATRGVYDADRSVSRPSRHVARCAGAQAPKGRCPVGLLPGFPSDHESTDSRSDIVWRHHMYEKTFRRTIKRAVEAAQLANSHVLNCGGRGVALSIDAMKYAPLIEGPLLSISGFV